MAQMINSEYFKEATEQEQEGGTWHSEVQSGKALRWDKLLEKLQKPAVYPNSIKSESNDKFTVSANQTRPINIESEGQFIDSLMI